MRRQEDSHVFLGMQQDFGMSKLPSQYLVDAHNIRFTINGDNTLLTITNEKGPKSTNASIIGTYLGHAVLNNYVVVFSTWFDEELGESGDYRDTITRLEINGDSIESKELYQVDYDAPNNIGNPRYPLGFRLDHPIKTLAFYETEDVQKVYWVDGVNQPRLINIVSSDAAINKFNANSFQFIQDLKLAESVSVTKKNSLQGIFPPGAIQYAFSYYNLYGQESNIFYTTPLMYTSYSDRAGSENDKCACVFEIKIDNVDQQFDYLRIYSILRTSLDASPSVKIVSDLKIDGNSNLFILDNGMYGENIDPQQLLYVGGEEISASTLCQKDNTLFFGNITLKRKNLLATDEEKNIIRNLTVTSSTRTISLPVVSESPYPQYNSLASTQYWNSSTYKHDEYYRLGIQFQHKNGKWSEPLFIDNFKQESFPTQSGELLTLPTFQLEHDPDSSIGIAFDAFLQRVKKEGYKKIRPIVVIPREEERTIICQGILNPTLFTIKDRYGKVLDPEEIPQETIYSWSSWFFRAMNKTGCCFYDSKSGGTSPQSRGTLMYPDWNNMISPPNVGYRDYASGRGFEMFVCRDQERLYNIDWNLLTLNSPELDMWDYFPNTQLDNCSLHNVGTIQINNTLSDIRIFTETPPIAENAIGAVRRQIKGIGACGIISGPFYNDGFVMDSWKESAFQWYLASIWDETEDATIIQNGNKKANKKSFYNVYLWQHDGSLNNDVSRISAVSEDNKTYGVQSALLQNKIISNLRISDNTIFNSEAKCSQAVELQGTPIYYRYEQDTIQKINGHAYQGNVDTAIAGDTFFGHYALVAGNPIYQNEDGETARTAYQDFIENLYYDMPLNINVVAAENDDFAPENAAYWQAIMPNPYVSNNEDNNELHADSHAEGYGNFQGARKVWVMMSTGAQLESENKYKWVGKKDPRIGNTFGLLAKKHNVRIKYKTSPHIVIQLKEGTKICYPEQDILYHNTKRYPHNDNYGQRIEEGDETIVIQNNTAQLTDQEAFLPIVELRREYNPNVMFGGKTNYAIQQNIWLPAGDPIDIDSQDLFQGKLVWKYGDTWYQRYDCLKTYPYSKEDTNQLVEILSCMLETHVNLEGRYDRNRGQISNITVSKSNFNLLNPVYSQTDNFFNYRILPSQVNQTSEFKNQFVWSLEKHPAEDIDKWTNVNLGSSYNTDGTLGEIVDIVNSNNYLYCFQSRGVSNILFNSRVQIQASDGVPIEITNNYKVEGVNYISTLIGCVNSASIISTQYGIYFLDSMGGELQFLGDKKIENLSQTKGVTLWFRRQLNKQWTPNNYTSKIFYDKQNQDIYVVTPDESLIYSERLQAFTSYMSYSEIDAMFDIGNSFYILNALPQQKEVHRLYRMFAGNYNDFFGEIMDYDLSFISNGVTQKENLSSLSKVFTNLDFRADTWTNGINNRSNLNNTTPFSHIRVQNEFQDTELVPISFKITPSNIKEKFRIWRIDIPRNRKKDNIKISGIMDRIRNPWCKISLYNKNPKKDMFQLHDINVSYFI